MATTVNGWKYEMYIRPWRKKGRYECIKWPVGYRNLWERITKEEYDLATKK